MEKEDKDTWRYSCLEIGGEAHILYYVYVLIKTSGSWDDRYSWPALAFMDENKANEASEEYNRKLQKIQNLIRERSPKDEYDEIDTTKASHLEILELNGSSVVKVKLI
jgi:hypothetical protein